MDGDSGRRARNRLVGCPFVGLPHGAIEDLLHRLLLLLDRTGPMKRTSKYANYSTHRETARHKDRAVHAMLVDDQDERTRLHCFLRMTRRCATHLNGVVSRPARQYVPVLPVPAQRQYRVGVAPGDGLAFSRPACTRHTQDAHAYV